MRHSVLTPFFGQLRDRFAIYGSPLPIAEKLQRAAAIPGVEGVEVIFPDEVGDGADVLEQLEALGLAVAAVNVNLKGEPAFRNGALTSVDPGVRRRAVELLCHGKDLAARLGAGCVTCAPLAEGYDYPLQVDYRSAWTHLVDGIGAAGSHRPDIALHVEHKPAEPRTRGLLDVPAKVLLLCHTLRLPRVGITFNTGHVAAGGGVPAAAFCDVLAARVPYYIHFGDASSTWDWDLRVGAQHPWLWAEFLYWLRVGGYDGWITADTFPVRQAAADVFAANVSFTDRVWSWLGQLDVAATDDALDRHAALPMLRELEQWLPVHA